MKSFKSGEIVNCITDGLHIECKIVHNTPQSENFCLVEDLLSGRRIRIRKSELDRDLSWKRNESLKRLGI